MIKKFVFREMVGEGHKFVIQDESGNDYDRRTFETLIPMDLKLLINPLYRTAVYSDDHTIHAVAMDSRYRPISRYQRVMFSGRTTMADTVFKALFPFWIKTTDKTSGYLQFDLVWNGWPALTGIALSLLVAVVVVHLREFRFKRDWPDLVVIMFTGIYGLIAVTMID